MEILIIPEEQVWPFVHRIVVNNFNGSHSMERNRKVTCWYVEIAEDAHLYLEQHVEVSPYYGLSTTYFVESIYTKGGVVLRDPQDMIDFMQL